MTGMNQTKKINLAFIIPMEGEKHGETRRTRNHEAFRTLSQLFLFPHHHQLAHSRQFSGHAGKMDPGMVRVDFKEGGEVGG